MSSRALPILKSGPTSCKGCGLCCEFFDHINLFSDDKNFDWLKDHNLIQEWNDMSPQWEMKQTESGRCVALRGVTGKDAYCSIYEHRPKTCEEFPSAGPKCNSIIMLDLHKCLGNGHKL